jgi:DNA-binding winged helix-turn-helix (wHTH) protein/Tfp pilus assembly protein PilF
VSGISPSGGIRFGAFELDPRTGELRKHGIRIKLQDQPFKILAALLEKPGEVVTREELRQRIWGHDTFVDFDHGLSAAVNRLREALNDSADHPRYVETLARRGYRFIAPVARTPEPTVPQRGNKSYRKLAWLAGLAIVAVAGSLIAGFLSFSLTRAPAHHEPSPQAQEAFEKGRVAWSQWTGEGARQAERFFQQAVAIDPNYARAYAWLSASHRQQATMGDADPREAYAEASQAAEKAIALDPQLSDGYHALATNFTFKPDWRAAERAFRTAIRLDPARSESHHALGIVLLAASPGRLPEAETELRRAVKLKPGDLGNRVVLAKILYFRGRLQEARAILDETLAINAYYPDAMRNLASVLLQMGDHREAVRLYEEAQKLAYLGWGDGLLGHAVAVSGDTGRARTVLSVLESNYASRPVGALAIATIHVGLQDWPTACEWLGRAWDNREIRARYVNVDPIYAPLRDKPCLAELLSTMKLSDLATPAY